MSGVPGTGDGIFVMNADGYGVSQLTDDWDSYSYSDSDPSWSSDGNKIAFHRYRFNEQDDSIFVMNADGTGVTQLTNNNDDDDMWPVWSPDGTQIAFARNRGWEIFVMNADGSDVVSLGQRGWPKSWGG